MNTKRLVLSAVVMWLANTVLIYLTCGWLFNWVYQIPPIIWLTPEAMMETTNMAASLLVGFIASFLFALVYAVFYKGIPGKGVKKGLHYGFFIWLVSALSGMAAMPFYMTIATTVVIYWIVQALILGLINGAILGAIYKE